MLTIHNVSGNLNFFAQVCEMGGIPNLGETPVLVRPMQNCAASLRTPFVRRQSNRKSAWQKRRFLTVRDISQELRRYVQNWTAPCVKFDAPLFAAEDSVTKL